MLYAYVKNRYLFTLRKLVVIRFVIHILKIDTSSPFVNDLSIIQRDTIIITVKYLANCAL